MKIYTNFLRHVTCVIMLCFASNLMSADPSESSKPITLRDVNDLVSLGQAEFEQGDFNTANMTFDLVCQLASIVDADMLHGRNSQIHMMMIQDALGAKECALSALSHNDVMNQQTMCISAWTIFNISTHLLQGNLSNLIASLSKTKERRKNQDARTKAIIDQQRQKLTLLASKFSTGYNMLTSAVKQANIPNAYDVIKKWKVKWYRKAAEQGNADAQSSLGVCYYYGDGIE